MARRRSAWFLALLAFPAPLWARAFEVKLLDGSERDGVWGTAEYQVRVTRLGAMRGLKVRGQEIMPNAGALYTAPIPPGGEAVRTVQGEGTGARGLTIEAPTFETSERRGARLFRLRHKVAKPSVFQGQTLCLVEQTIELTPTGEIRVEYGCTWVRTCRWGYFMAIMFFSSDVAAGRPFMGLRGDRIFAGRLDLGVSSPSEARLREPLEQLTIRTRVGPVHVVWDKPLPTTLSWRGNVQLRTQPAAAGYRSEILSGVRDRLAYRILLPVSQQ